MMRIVVASICLLFLCSCVPIVTYRKAPDVNPADVDMNKDAGRGGPLTVNVHLQNWPDMAFVIDTGWNVTTFDKSLEPELGRRLGSVPVMTTGGKVWVDLYNAPDLYLGGTQLVTGAFVATMDLQSVSYVSTHPIMGILGTDVLRNYCIQLDFAGSKIRFLDYRRSGKSHWGVPFRLKYEKDGMISIATNLVGAPASSSAIDTGYVSDGWLVPALYGQWTNHSLSAAGEVRFPDAVLGGKIYTNVDFSLDFFLDPNIQKKWKWSENGIGLFFLARNLVTLDFPEKMIYLKQTSAGPLSFDLDADSPMSFLCRLKAKGKLPGFSKDDEITVNGSPKSVYLTKITKSSDPSRYHYTVVRSPDGNGWKLIKAWRTDDKGKVLELYPLN